MAMLTRGIWASGGGDCDDGFASSLAPNAPTIDGKMATGHARRHDARLRDDV